MQADDALPASKARYRESRRPPWSGCEGGAHIVPEAFAYLTRSQRFGEEQLEFGCED